MNYQDINHDIDGVSFSIRSCGFIQKDDQILLHKKKYDDFCALIGGRVKANESTIEAIQREFNEELHIHVQVIKLIYCIENFFKHRGKHPHELMFVYLLETDDVLPTASFMVEGNLFSWFDQTQFKYIRIKPDFFKDWDAFFPTEIKHMIYR